MGKNTLYSQSQMEKFMQVMIFEIEILKNAFTGYYPAFLEMVNRYLLLWFLSTYSILRIGTFEKTKKQYIYVETRKVT